MLSPDVATIEALRRDVALQIARRTPDLATNQLAAARHLGIPQPTLSKIMNGRVSGISLELLLRIAIRAGLPMTLQTGQVPEEAGAFVAATSARPFRAHVSRLSDAARDAVVQSGHGLTPEQRLEAFLEHNQLVGELHSGGRRAEAERARHGGRR